MRSIQIRNKNWNIPSSLIFVLISHARCAPLHLAIAIAATQQLDIIIPRHHRHTTAQQRTPQAIMVHPICFDDTAVAAAPVADTDTDINSEQAAAASR
jgi:hypothetical protein